LISMDGHRKKKKNTKNGFKYFDEARTRKKGRTPPCAELLRKSKDFRTSLEHFLQGEKKGSTRSTQAPKLVGGRRKYDHSGSKNRRLAQQKLLLAREKGEPDLG